MGLLHHPLSARSTLSFPLKVDSRIFLFFLFHFLHGGRAYPTRSIQWYLSTSDIFKARALGIRSFTVSGGNKLRNTWHLDSFTLSFRSYFLFHPLGDPLQTEGVDDLCGWHGPENLVPLAEPQSHQEVRGP